MQTEENIFLTTDSTDPAYNLAFEEFVLTHRRTGDILMLWQNDNAIIIGRNQNTAAEINQSFVDAHAIRVVRRITGGGAVYHDLGNLNYSFITDLAHANELVLARFAAPVVAALRGLHLNAKASGRNDILVEGHKVSGTAQRIHLGRILFHGTLLFDSNPDMIAGALNADPLKFSSRASGSVKSRIGNIRHFLKEDMSLDAFRDYLKNCLSADGYTDAALTAEELAEISRLQREKYDTWEWNYGTSPRYDFSNKLRFDGGILEVCAAVAKGGEIETIVFFGDFLATEDLAPLTAALQGVPFRRAEVSAVLDRFPLHAMFGQVTKDEILQTLFP